MNTSHFYVKHKATHTKVELFTAQGSDTEIQKLVQAKKDQYGGTHEVVNVSIGRYNFLKNEKSLTYS